MNRYEYLTQLDEYLKGNVSDRERQESVQYYTEYIENEIAAGRTEEEVLSELGSPYSIGKSITEAKGSGSFDDGGTEGYGYSEYGYSGEEEPKGERALRQIHLDGWKSWLVLGGILFVIFLLLSFVFRVFVVLLPYVIPLMIIVFVIRMFSGRR